MTMNRESCIKNKVIQAYFLDEIKEIYSIYTSTKFFYIFFFLFKNYSPAYKF